MFHFVLYSFIICIFSLSRLSKNVSRWRGNFLWNRTKGKHLTSARVLTLSVASVRFKGVRPHGELLFIFGLNLDRSISIVQNWSKYCVFWHIRPKRPIEWCEEVVGGFSRACGLILAADEGKIEIEVVTVV